MTPDGSHSAPPTHPPSSASQTHREDLLDVLSARIERLHRELDAEWLAAVERDARHDE